MKIILVIATICASLIAAFGIFAYRSDAEHYRAVLREVLWTQRAIHPGQPAATAKSALRERGYHETSAEAGDDTRFVKSFDKLPWGAKMVVLLSSTGDDVVVVTVTVEDQKSGRPYLL